MYSNELGLFPKEKDLNFLVSGDSLLYLQWFQRYQGLNSAKFTIKLYLRACFFWLLFFKRLAFVRKCMSDNEPNCIWKQINWSFMWVLVFCSTFHDVRDIVVQSWSCLPLYPTWQLFLAVTIFQTIITPVTSTALFKVAYRWKDNWMKFHMQFFSVPWLVLKVFEQIFKHA